MAEIAISPRAHDAQWAVETGAEHVFRLGTLRGTVLEVPDVHFHHDSLVFLPSYVGSATSSTPTRRDPSIGLGAIAEALLQAKTPARKIMIVGHADTSGPDAYNVGISIKRANAVRHVILGERADFVALCEQQHKGEDIQLILDWVASVYGWDCHAGAIDDIVGDRTRTATRRFQDRYNAEFEASIAVDGAVGPQTWGAFFHVYQDMLQHLCETDDDGLAALRATFASSLLDPGVVGCGEHFPIEQPRRRNYRSRINRRVEVLLFDAGQEPRVRDRCHPGGATCRAEVCEVYDPSLYEWTHLDARDSIPRGNRVFLTLGYLDPENTERPFPPDFPVTVVYPGDAVPAHVERVGADGTLRFSAARGPGSFTLRFDATEPTWVAVSADGSTTRLGRAGDLAQLHQDGFRFFRMPKQFTLVESKWEVSESRFCEPDPSYRFLVPGRFGRSIGTAASPVTLTLDPHWSFVRLEFFDRTFGHSDHGHRRINLPAIVVSGWRTSPASGDPDTAGHWTIQDGDPAKSVHAIPWIVQRKSDGSDDARPDANIQLGFTTDWLHASEQAVVVSKSATERVVETRPGSADDLKPSAKRLSLYDLPREWRSQGWFTRFADGTGEFFDQATSFDAKIKDSLKHPDKPLTFSLDDIVLTDAALAPITLQATDRVAVFFHKFAHDDAAGKTSTIGLFEFDDAGDASYQSKVDLHGGRNYVADYPNWTRLVVAQENLFDVFSERVTSGPVIGARAGVRWVDGPAAGPPAPATLSAAGPATTMAAGTRTDRTFFSLQPFAEQRYAQTNLKFTGPASTAQGIGRYDLALLRCCDRDGDVERIVTLRYLRLFLTFNPSLPAQFHPPSAGAATARAQYGDRLATNVINRWNGHDVQNTKRVELLPKTATDQVEGQAVVFIQPVASNQRAHFTIDVIGSGSGGGRAWMFALNGTGELSDESAAMEQRHSRHSYTAAHEVGHACALPDEYNERWRNEYRDAAGGRHNYSYDEQSITGNTPGDPYEMDTQTVTAGATVASTVRDTGMMVGNVDVRNRYFWPEAEFARVVTGVTLKVKYDTYDDFLLPPHPQAPARSYAWWPIAQAVDRTAGTRGFHDVLLYALGKDHYGQRILANGPFDGILVVTVKVEYTLFTNQANDIRLVLPELTRGVATGLNRKFYAKGTVHQGAPEEYRFEKCLIHFSPRFQVTNNNNSAGAQYTNFLNNNRLHFVANVNAVAPPANSRWAGSNALWSGAAAVSTLILELETPSAAPLATAPTSWKAKLRRDFADKFCGMLGLAEHAAAITANDLLPLVQSVITTNAEVHGLP